MSDIFDPDPQYLQEAERFAARDAEQAEWEREQRLDMEPHQMLPKPRRPHRASRSEWGETKRVFSDKPCQVCGGQSTDLHHILSRDGDGTWPRGDDYRSNLAALCRECHQLITERDMATRAALRAALDWKQLDYLRRRIGRERVGAYLERHYPLKVAA